MKTSDGRVLTTHVGSLLRPNDLAQDVIDRSLGRSANPQALEKRIRREISGIVKVQAQHGLDVINDGEFSKPGFVNYVNERLAGFEAPREPSTGSYWMRTRDALEFPDYYEWLAKQSGVGANVVGQSQWECVRPIKYIGNQQLERDLENLHDAISAVKIEEAFMSSVACTTVEGWNRNRFYERDEDYLYAIADAMREEYKAIIDSGFILQIDDPDLATHYIMHPEKSVEECRKWAIVRAEAVNYSIRGLPKDRIRYHTCYSINIGPRANDMELKDFIDIFLSIKVGAYSFEAGNIRHEHEWTLWNDAALAADALIIPGVITNSSPLVEHPELVAQRLVRFAEMVGRERVIAGADCGFASLATSKEIPPSVVWAKFDSLVKGAKLASDILWGPNGS